MYYFFLFLAFILFILISIFRLYFLLKRAYNYSKNFSQTRKVFQRLSGEPTIFVYGDSTAFGVGSSSPEKSLAGLLGEYYPNATIVNRAGIGLTIEQITETMGINDSGELVIIGCGGVDLLYLKSPEYIRSCVKKLFSLATQKSNKVIVVTPLNPGLSTIFPRFISWFYIKRSNKIGQIFLEESKLFDNISVVNLFTESNKTAPPWKSISAPDQLHPNDKGYLWTFEKMKPLLKS